MTIALIARWISIVGGTTLLITGTIGGLFNIILFSDRSLRTCSCSWYVLTAAIFDLITLDHALLLRVLSDGFGLDPISLNVVYCKLRFYTGQIGSFMPITMICLAASDRWACTCRSSWMRRWSSVQKARYAILASLLVWIILSFPNLLVYEIVSGACRQTSLTYNDYLAFFLNPILYGVVPICVLAIFGYMTHLNIVRLAHQPQRSRAKIEEQLARAIILQCISFILSQLPYTIWNLYLTLTSSENKSLFRTDLESLFTQLTRLLFYLNYVSAFYINLIASKHVRSLLRLHLLFLIGQRRLIDNRLHPITNTISRSIPQSAAVPITPIA